MFKKRLRRLHLLHVFNDKNEFDYEKCLMWQQNGTRNVSTTLVWLNKQVMAHEKLFVL